VELTTMTRERTIRILSALANGVHPATGEKLAADGPYQHPDTVRALFEAWRAMEGRPIESPTYTGAERRRSHRRTLTGADRRYREERRS